MNANDHSNEGIIHKYKPFFSAQVRCRSSLCWLMNLSIACFSFILKPWEDQLTPSSSLTCSWIASEVTLDLENLSSQRMCCACCRQANDAEHCCHGTALA